MLFWRRQHMSQSHLQVGYHLLPTGSEPSSPPHYQKKSRCYFFFLLSFQSCEHFEVHFQDHFKGRVHEKLKGVKANDD